MKMAGAGQAVSAPQFCIRSGSSCSAVVLVLGMLGVAALEGGIDVVSKPWRSTYRIQRADIRHRWCTRGTLCFNYT